MGTSSSIFWDYWGKTTAKLWWSCSVECFVILELFQKAWNFRLLFFETAVMKSVKKEKINVMKCNQNFKKNFVSHCNVFHIINEILESSETKITCGFFCDFESLPDDVLVLYRTKYIAKLKYLFWLSIFQFSWNKFWCWSESMLFRLTQPFTKIEFFETSKEAPT